jgi:hypothetical protein
MIGIGVSAVIADVGFGCLIPGKLGLRGGDVLIHAKW